MAATLAPVEAPVRARPAGGNFVTLPPEPKGGWDGPDRNERVVQRYKLAVWVGMGGILMFFAALTSAMIVRQGLSGDWQPFALPPVLYASTMILLASSLTMERARRHLLEGSPDGLRLWVNISALLGVSFLACQLLGWQALVARGIYLASNPANSFYYLLTAGHGAHLIGGVCALGYIWARVRGGRAWPTREAAVEAAALYWHFMDILWIYILGLLLFWR